MEAKRQAGHMKYARLNRRSTNSTLINSPVFIEHLRQCHFVSATMSKWNQALVRIASASDPTALPTTDRILFYDDRTITIYDGFR